MNISIGEYIRQKLRSKNISNKNAGNSIGLSESAFEKILTQNDIYASRLLKLSELSNENIFEYYYNIEPIKSFLKQEAAQWKEKIEALEKSITIKEHTIEDKDQIIQLQNKLIAELEEKLNQR